MDHTIVIFGASGDLTRRKLIPALYQLRRKGRLSEGTRIVGFSRTAFSHQAWREKLAESTAGSARGEFDRSSWDQFAPAILYHPGDIARAEDFSGLREFLDQLEGGDKSTRVYYLATAPQYFKQAIAHLGAANLVERSSEQSRVVIEKPFGTDLASAQHLNKAVHQVFDESQVYRIDHYLGKETVQNVLVLRFANAVFEPIWNRNYVDHVQITAAEAATVGHRAEYYEQAGVLRDMLQSHLLQLLTLTAMEAPARFEPNDVRDEKAKVLRAIRPLRRDDVARDTLRGQYREYREEPGAAPNSRTATFGVIKLWIDNWRWQDVPFYLRTGKAMSCRTTQIVIQFRQPPHMMFDGGPRSPQDANRLVLQIQPAEGIQLHFQTKVPDAGMHLRLTDLNLDYRETFAGPVPEAYERLLLDVLQGDASLFSRSDEVELAWSIIDPIAQVWEASPASETPLYASGGWGPASSTEWMQRQGREWFDTCPVLK